MKTIAGVMLTVKDIERMTAFFVDVLSFEKVGSSHLVGKEYDALFGIPNTNAELVILKLGNEFLYLISFDPHGAPFPSIVSNDLLFQHIAIVVSDLDKAYQVLAKHGIQGISEKPITIPEWNKAAAGIQAYYFRSPENHPLELIYFTPDKGKPHWHHQDKLFLGIDHTAIVVSNTNTSLRYYQDQLGMAVMGESLNYGDTQETLSRVKGAKVQITGLGFKASEGMGLEFLHYLNPTNGSPAPALKANDLGCTYTVMEMNELDQLPSKPLSLGQFMPYHSDTPHAAMITEDTDGHRILFFNKEHSHAIKND